MYYIIVSIVNYENGQGQMWHQSSGKQETEEEQKCKKAAIMAMALTQHERLPGHPDSWECKVNEHTCCVVCFFVPGVELFFLQVVVTILFLVLCHLTVNIL